MMNGRWFPRPMAQFSQPQKWSNSSTHAPVFTQYFVRRPLITQVVVQRRLQSVGSPALRALRSSSTPEQPLTRAGTFPGSDRATVKNRAREAGTPSSKQSETLGATVQLMSLKSVRYWKRANDTLTSQNVAAAFCRAFFFSLSASSLLASLRRRFAPDGASMSLLSPTTPTWLEPATSSNRSSVRRMAVSWFPFAMSMHVRPCWSVCDGSTCLSSRNSQTPPWEACTARCKGVMPIASRHAKSASK
mmetsp:Transcript_40295/g.108902  ORF Transcript_40295/g.108902 Transcript_40295/m.108902 type:complete len:246 (+) Transcript_40295:505-1242(+)